MKLRPATPWSESSLPSGPTVPAALPPPAGTPELRRARTRFGIMGCALIAVFSPVLFGLGSMAWNSDLFSYILLIPFAVALLIWWRADTVLTAPVRPAWMAAGIFAVLGSGVLAWRYASPPDAALPAPDQLAGSMLAFVLFVVAAALASFGTSLLARIAGPVAMLLLMVPFPSRWEAHLETFLQHGSAMMAEPLFALWGTPLLRDDLIFRLPGIALQVAPECSGIHSTVVLFITSVIASLLLLQCPWSRLVLIAAVIPLALMRNGLRVFVIGQLCVDYGNHMLHSWVHTHGGKLFFALSMIPLLALVLALMRWERRRPRAAPPPST